MRITKKQIASRLGCEESQIAQALDDLLGALDEEIQRREEAERAAAQLREQLRLTAVGLSEATKYASEQREAALKLAAMVKELRHSAKPHPSRRAKTRRRI